MSVPEKHHPTPEERDERVSVPLDPTEFIEGVLAVEPDDVRDYDIVVNAEGHRCRGTLADAHRRLNEIVGPGDDWVINDPSRSGAGRTVSKGCGPVSL